MCMTDDTDLQPMVAGEFQQLADFLAAVTPAQWDAPSLCEGWRVREVVAHMTMAARYDEAAFMAELQDVGFDFTALSNKVAARDGALDTAELVANLRSDVMAQWAPPGGGYRGALNHVVIHGLDITEPLGAPRLQSDDTMRVILDDLTAGGGHEHFGVDITGRRFEATDLDWRYGEGANRLTGTAAAIALALCGRD
jgi:uncharacterized protein (TIGR03083 family)